MIRVEGVLPRAIGLTRSVLARAAAFFADRSSARIGVPFREVTVILQDDAFSAEVHHAVNGVAGATDVVTQRYDAMPGEDPGIYGELYVNVNQALRAAPRRKGWNVGKELLLYVAHGMDHLSGADDLTPADYDRMRRRELSWLRKLTTWLLAFAVAILLLPESAQALEISNRYRSPRNPERKVRASTELIVLHTTEAPARSSLNKLSDRGEAHFCVTEEGSIYAIVDRDREAFHAGRSMWKGKEDVDGFSVGIECVGHHDKPMSIPQLAAIRNLVKELQRIYRIPDERVVCHSHVAYGSPNKWQKRRHRGRKRCGMLFAMPSVRRILELKSRPSVDVDVRAGRLVVGDDFLKKVLYGGIDTMRTHYPVVKPVAKAPAKPAAAVSPRTDSAAARAPQSVAELQARGYVRKGAVSKSQTASKLAGARWNASDTYYTIRNKVIPGDQLDPAHIEAGMSVWLKEK